MLRLPALLFACLAGTAAAQSGPAATLPSYACRSHPGFDSDQVPVAARVVHAPTGRAYFFDDREGCPAADGCRRKAYLVDGDEVIVDRIAGGWACAWYDGKHGTTMGYLREDALELEPAAVEVAPDEYPGHWLQVDGGESPDFIDIVLSDGKLIASGEALWFGAKVDGERNVHTGSIDDETLSLDEGTASFAAEDEYDCAATFRLVGKYLLVDDNGYCGGMNVTFDGIYRREPAKP
jgi:hypothetical protein